MDAFNQKIPTYSQYGNTLVPSQQVALLRGSGNFNPPPLWEQSTNRGPAYEDAFNKAKIAKSSTIPIGFDDIQEYTDDLRKRAYRVGETGFHPETDWSTEEFTQNQYVIWAQKALVPGGMMMTPFIAYLFSVENVEYIQDRIKKEVEKHTGKKINDQSTDELLIIMRNVCLYAYAGWLPGGGKDNLTNAGPKKIPLAEILKRANKSIIEEGVRQVLSGILMYEKYYLDKSSLPMPLDMPVYTSQKGGKSLSENIGFNSGLQNSVSYSSFNERYNIL